jgi:hypothetical protein
MDPTDRAACASACFTSPECYMQRPVEPPTKPIWMSSTLAEYPAGLTAKYIFSGGGEPGGPRFRLCDTLGTDPGGF